MKPLVQEYLRDMRDAFTYLSHDSGTGFFSAYSSIPLLVLVFIIATANSIITCIVGPAFTLTLLLITSIRRSKTNGGGLGLSYSILLKTILIVSLMVLIVSAPILVLRGFSPVSLFLARTISSTTVFILMVQAVGWLNIVRGLEVVGAPRTIIEMIYQTIKFIPLFLSETLKLLVARDARVIGNIRLGSLWKILSSIVGELLVKAYHRSIMLGLALEARTLSSTRNRVKIGYLTVYDICLIIVTVALLFHEVLDRIWSGI